ncbi:acyltransferase family protein [Pseudooceanicola sp. 502str34]
MLVVLCHAIAHPLPSQPELTWTIGVAGVTLFFVLSGFIMVVTTGHGRFNPGAFMTRRILRVVPLYYVMSILAAVLALALPSAFKGTVFDIGHLVKSLLFIPAERPGSDEIVPVLKLGWTLNFEMYFYLIFAGFAWLDARQRALAVTLFFGASVVIGALTHFESPVLEFYTRRDTLAFVAGVWIGILHINDRLSNWEPLALAGLVAGVVLVMVNIYLVDVPLIDLVSSVTLFCACAVLLLAGRVNRYADRVPRWFLLSGDASYSIYLAHIFAIGAVYFALSGLPYLVQIVVAFTAGTAAGFFVYFAIERPLTRAAQRAVLRPRRRAAAHVSPGAAE